MMRTLLFVALATTSGADEDADAGLLLVQKPASKITRAKVACSDPHDPDCKQEMLNQALQTDTGAKAPCTNHRDPECRREILNQVLKTEMLQTGTRTLGVGLVSCTHTCIFDSTDDCTGCIRTYLTTIVPGPNGISVDYIKDMLALKFSPTYAAYWCGGEIRGCGYKEKIPGEFTTSIMGWDNVVAKAKLLPEKEWSGEWWRGNELGFIINNAFFWKKNKISPPSILLGGTPKQHAATRPYIEKAFTLEKRTADEVSEIRRTITDMADKFMKERKEAKSLKVPSDLTAFVHQVLNKVALGRDVSWDYALSFIEAQDGVVKLATLSQMFPEFLHGFSFMTDKQDAVARFVTEYHGIIQQKWGTELDKADCSPSESCVWQLASGTWDAFYSAGGLSVPTNLATGLGLIWSKDSTRPFDASSLDFSRGDVALQFTWENHRYFAPVVGFPHWTTRPTCAGSTAEETAKLNASDGKTQACNWMRGDDLNDVNQYQGGVRVVPNLALAQLDPAKWGDDAGTFRLRPLKDYRDNSVGFAEPAVNDNIANGAMNRICPGKSLALMIGSEFWKVFAKYKDDFEQPDDSIVFGAGPSWVSPFELVPKEPPCTAWHGCWHTTIIDTITSWWR